MTLYHNFFLVNNVNGSGRNFITWAWKAGGDKGTFNVDDVGYNSLVEMKDRSGVDIRGDSIGSGNITPTRCSINTTSKFGIYKYIHVCISSYVYVPITT